MAQAPKPERSSSPAEDAPDIPDPEADRSRRPRGQPSSVARGVNDIRSGGARPQEGINPRELLEKADRNFRAGTMSRIDYDKFVDSILRRFPDAATRDHRSRGETKPWYSQTDDSGRYEVEKTKLDYRDSLWVDEWDPKVARERQRQNQVPERHRTPPPPPSSTVVQPHHDPRLDQHPRDIDRRK